MPPARRPVRHLPAEPPTYSARPLAMCLAVATSVLALPACRADPDSPTVSARTTVRPANPVTSPTAPSSSSMRPTPPGAQPTPRADLQPKPALTVAKLIETMTSPQTLSADPSVPAPKPPPDNEHPGLTSSRADGQPGIDFPLMHTEVRAEVTGNIARVELTQLYKNPTTDRLEAIYQFPLPANAAVTEMYFRIGNRVIWGEVKKKDEARATYDAAKREGHTAALTEQQRPNLFTQSVANIPPGESIAVVLRYVHEVPFDDGRYSFVFPTTVGPRYIPGDPTGHSGPGWSADTDQVPDAAKITPPVLAGHGVHDVDIVVKLSPGAAFGELRSRNHRIVTGLDGTGARLVALAEDDRVPNKDFVLAYAPVGAQPDAHVIAQREKGDDYLMLFLQPPQVVADADVRPREMVFLLDKSGSMMGEPIDTAKALVREALHRLRPQDTFQLVAFDSGVTEMSTHPLANTAENVKAADAWLESLQGGGGTEMLSGILAALTPASDPSRLRMVVFCTDGFIGNEPAVLRAVAEHRGSAHVFGFGIGSSVNRYLIEGVGRAGRGASEVVGLHDSIEESVARLYKRLDRPVLTDLSVKFDGLAVQDLSPTELPDLFAGQPLVVVGRYAKGSGTPRVTLSGRIGTRAYSKTMALELSHDDSAPVLGTLWARRRIDELSSASPYQPAMEDVAAITELGLRFHLITAYTSLVAVERELKVDPGVPLTQVLVPSELPDGVRAEGIFGETPGAGAEILPSRVKPGDPELRMRAETGATVEVTLPFESEPRQAIYDEQSGDYVVRFLVPPSFADGSYQTQVQIRGADGTVRSSEVPLRVDTTAATLAVVHAPSHVRAGERFALSFKPALPIAQLLRAVVSPNPGGRVQSLTGAMDVKEVLVRAPWGEVVRAKLEGPLGLYRAELEVPSDWANGPAALEVVATDAAGNVSRRSLELTVGTGETATRELIALSVTALAAAAVVARRRKLRLA